MEQTVLGAYPQAAIHAFAQSCAIFADELRVGGVVENLKGAAIKPRQTTARGHPEKTIAGLKDGLHRIVRQAVLSRPNSLAKFRGGVGRFGSTRGWLGGRKRRRQNQGALGYAQP